MITFCIISILEITRKRRQKLLGCKWKHYRQISRYATLRNYQLLIKKNFNFSNQKKFMKWEFYLILHQQLQDFGSGESMGNVSEGAPAGGCRGLAAPLPGSTGRAPGGVRGRPQKISIIFIDFSLKINLKFQWKFNFFRIFKNLQFWVYFA